MGQPIEVRVGGVRVALGIASTPAMETPKLAFGNPYLACVTCGRRAVASVGPTVNIATASIMPSATNWPCYHANGRISLCDNWAPSTGCTHTPAERAAHGRPRDTDMNQTGQPGMGVPR